VVEGTDDRAGSDAVLGILARVPGLQHELDDGSR
jgi:hypothetical protein